MALMAVVPMDAADTSFYDPDMHLIEGGESLEYVEKIRVCDSDFFVPYKEILLVLGLSF